MNKNGVEIYDDFLTSDEFESLCQWSAKIQYSKAKRDSSTILSLDKRSYEGPLITSGTKFAGQQIYPTKTPIDNLFTKISALLQHETSKSKQSTIDQSLSLTPQLMPKGCRLPWNYAGRARVALIFHLNNYGRDFKGGELLIEPQKRTIDTKTENNVFCNKNLSNVILEGGQGMAILPKENRLIAFDSEYYCSVLPVTDGVRASILGLFC